MIRWSKVIKNGVLATITMELFYRITNVIFHHGIDVPYANGTVLALTSPFLIYLAGYFVFLFGGVMFSFFYERFIRTKNYVSGILYTVLFVWLIVDGLIFEPIGPAGILMLGAGIKAAVINLIAHVVYGSVLGLTFANGRQKALTSNFAVNK
ncbi:hypothetical protein [Paenibacillus sp. SI8]|uniref:hypothetical protein n=1 Tax=unclassified Paenibacillus TaxID=185978 RepID=UPI0034656C7C